MAQYPTSLSTDATLYIAVNNIRTQLNGAINNSVTTITVDSTTGFPTSGLASIGSEIFSYTGTNATQFTGVTRGADGTTAASHNDDAFVVLRVVAAHHNNLKDEVIAVETALGTNMSNVVQITGTQSIAGAKTFTDPITQNDTTNQLILGTTRTVTINAPTPATSSRTVTLPDQSADYSVVATEGTQTINGNKTFSGTTDVTGQLKGKGTATNDSAASGYIGELIESAAVGDSNAAATTVVDDLTSISLTAGDWNVSALVRWDNNGATWTQASCFIGTVSGNNTTGLDTSQNYDNTEYASSATTPVSYILKVIDYRISLTSTTTYYLKRQAVYTAGTPRTRAYRISARRVR